MNRTLRRLLPRRPAAPKEGRDELLARADAARGARRHAEAAALYASVLARGPEDAALHVQCGHMSKEAGQLDRAERHYLAALALTPDDPDLHLQLGHFRKVAGQAAEAAASYRRAALLKPGWAEPLEEHAALQRGLSGLPVPAPLPDTAEDDEVDPALARLAGPADPAFRRELLDEGVGEGELPYPDLDGMLASNGITSRRFLPLFDPVRYRLANAFGGPRPRGRTGCLRHFCEWGLDAGLDISAAHALDPDFYRETYLRAADPAACGRGALLRHWINHGLPAGWAPNPRAWLQQETGVDVPDPALLELGPYRAWNPDLAGMPERALLVHLLRNGALEARRGVVVTPDNAGLFAEVAARAAGQGDAGRAATLFDLILHHVPDSGPACHAAAGLMGQLGRHREAAALYRAAVAGGAGSIWSYLHGAEALARLHDPRGAYDLLRAAQPLFRSDADVLPRRLRAAADSLFAEVEVQARSAAVAGRVEEAQARMRGMLEAITPPAAAPASRRPVEAVAIVSGCDLPQCRFYRVEGKVEQLRAAGYAVEVFGWQDGLDRFAEEVGNFGAAIFYRVAATPGMIAAIQRARAFGLATFYEVDDLIFDLRHYPGAYENYAGSISRQLHAELSASVELHAHAARLCEYGLASTPTLAAELGRLVGSGTAFVHRNALGRAHERHRLAAHVPGDPEDRVTIFYGSGTLAHKQDFRDLAEPALEALAARHGRRIRVLIAGHSPLSGRSEALAAVAEFLPPVWNVAAYWAVLREADINLAVLARSLNTDSKSEIKWLEAAMFRIPSVVSRNPTYEEAVEDGVDGFLAASPEEFLAALERLVADPGLRRQVGDAAHDTAIARYGEAAMAANLRGILGQVAPPVARRRRLVVVNVFYPPQDFGGGTRVVHDNVGDLKRLYGDEYEIEVFATIEGGGPEPYAVSAYSEGGVRVTGVTCPEADDLDRRPLDPRMGEIFGEYLDRTVPDLVHFHCIQRLTASVAAAALERGVPYLITAHDGWWVSDHIFLADEGGRISTYDYADPVRVLREQGGAAAGRMAALREPLLGARAVLTVSERFAALYRACGVASARAVPNGVPALPPTVRVPAEGRVRLTHVGGLQPHKGAPLVRQALEEGGYRNLALTILDFSLPAGSVGRERWGTTPVTVLPRIAGGAIGELYARTDVLLAPSTCVESFGLATREAAAAGAWVVASDRGSIGEAVRPGLDGELVGVDDASDLARVLRAIDADPARYTASPPGPPALRPAEAQARDLHAIYGALLDAGAGKGDAGRAGAPAAAV